MTLITYTVHRLCRNRLYFQLRAMINYLSEISPVYGHGVRIARVSVNLFRRRGIDNPADNEEHWVLSMSLCYLRYDTAEVGNTAIRCPYLVIS